MLTLRSLRELLQRVKVINHVSMLSPQSLSRNITATSSVYQRSERNKKKLLPDTHNSPVDPTSGEKSFRAAPTQQRTKSCDP